jgi:ferredoxin-NADP reductase
MAAPDGEIHFLGVSGMFTPALAEPVFRPVLLVAGGIGVTPMRAMIPEFIAAKRPVALVYSVRMVSEAPFLAELTPRAGCSVTVTATAEPEDSAWTGRRGRIDAALLDSCAPGRGGARACIVFICGPRPFEDACRAALASLGLTAEYIFSESFESTP